MHVPHIYSKILAKVDFNMYFFLHMEQSYNTEYIHAFKNVATTLNQQLYTMNIFLESNIKIIYLKLPEMF